MSFTQVYIHAVWATKNRYPFMDHESKNIICDFIFSYSKDKGIFIDCLNGHSDHLHCLFGVNADLSLSKHLQYFKGASAHWINNTGKLFASHFGWADDYFAASVSKDKLEVVRSYIKNQEEHHRKVSFQEEYEGFLKSFGFFQG